jgi:ribosomal protein S6--L-glutamate ligase
MRRTAAGDEFRSNVHRGGTVEPVDLPPEYAQAAVRSAQIMACASRASTCSRAPTARS